MNKYYTLPQYKLQRETTIGISQYNEQVLSRITPTVTTFRHKKYNKNNFKQTKSIPLSFVLRLQATINISPRPTNRKVDTTKAVRKRCFELIFKDDEDNDRRTFNGSEFQTTGTWCVYLF